MRANSRSVPSEGQHANPAAAVGARHAAGHRRDAEPAESHSGQSAPPTADDLLQRMASEASDDCVPDVAPSVASRAELSDLQRQLFDVVTAQVADRLNAPSPVPSANAGPRATSALRDVEQWSAEHNKSWPDEDRFHFKVLDLPPAVLILMSYRSHASMVLFGSFNLNKGETSEPGKKWREVGFVDPSSLRTRSLYFRCTEGRAATRASWRRHGIAVVRARSAKTTTATSGTPTTGS